MVKVAITCDIDEEERIRLLVHYHEAVAAAGAVPLIVPPYTVEKDLSVWLDCVRPDGLMLADPILIRKYMAKSRLPVSEGCRSRAMLMNCRCLSSLLEGESLYWAFAAGCRR